MGRLAHIDRGWVVLVALTLALVASSALHAATLPYNGTDLRLWLRADGHLNLDPGPSNTDRVLGWYDETGQGGNTVAEDGVGPGGNRPLWVDNVINGRPVVRFNAGNRRIDGPAALPAGGGAKTIMLVASSSNNGNYIIFDPNGQGPTPNGNVLRITPEMNVRYGNGLTGFTGGALTGLEIITVQTGATHSQTVLWRDGTLATGTSNNPGNPVNTGTQGYRSGGNNWLGDLAEVLVFEGHLTATEHARIGLYLEKKYGLAATFAAPVFFDNGDATDNDWQRPANWDPDGEPGNLSEAYIHGGLTAQVTQAGEAAGSLTVGSNNAGGPGAGTGTLNVVSGDLTVDTNLRLGEGTAAQKGTVNQTGGAVTVGLDLQFGSTGSGGSDLQLYDLNGGTLSVAGDVTHVGGSVRGHLYVDEPNALSVTGDINIQSFRTGDNEAGSATLTGGTELNLTGTLLVGRAADGDLTLDGGTHTVANMTVGDVAGSVGSTLTLQNGASLTVTQTGDNRLDVGDANGSGGTIDILGGSSLTISGRVDLGQAGTAQGTINVTDGLLDINNRGLYVAGDGTNDGNTTGTLTVGASGQVDVNGGNTEVGRGGTGTFTLDGGTFNQNANNFVIAQTGGSAQGTATINSGALNVTNDLNMNGGTGGGILNITGGVVTIGDNLALGTNAAGTSVVNLGGGTLNVAHGITDGAGDSTINFEEAVAGLDATDIAVDHFNVNLLDSGTTAVVFVRSGGTMTVKNDLRLGGPANSGDNDKGNLRQTGGTVNVQGNLVFGGAAGHEGGTYNLDGGALNVSGAIVESDPNVDAAQLHLDGGTLNVTGDITVQRFAVAQDGGTAATYTIPNGQTVTSTGTTAVGSHGTGVLNVPAGATLISANYISGEYSDGAGTLNIMGGSWTSNGETRIGENGVATFNLIDGTFTLTANSLRMANQNSGQGTLVMGTADGSTSPTMTLHGQWESADNNIGTTTLWSGTVTQTNGNFITGQNVGSESTVQIGGGAGTVVYNLTGGDGNRDWNTNKGHGIVGVLAGGTVNVGRNMNLGNHTDADSGLELTINGGTVNVGTAKPAGSSRIDYRTNGPKDQINLVDGVLNLNGGTIYLRDATSSQFSMTGGRLEDVGTFHGGGEALVQDGGTLAPGGSIGTTTITHGYTQNAGVLEIEIASATSSDLLDVDGAITLNGELQVIFLGGYVPVEMTSWLILDNDGTDTTGPFPGLPEGAVLHSQGLMQPLQITYLGGDGNDIALTAVPEPATMALLGLAACGLGGYLRRRRDGV